MSLIKQVRMFFESRTGVVTSRDLARNFIKASPIEVADIIGQLGREGFLKIRYRVVKPSGEIYEQEFDDLRDIPDTYDQASDVVPVFYRM